jgi:hypothetical protein
MTEKIKIGIDINEILRAKWLQFDRYYFNEFGADGVPTNIPYVYDYFNTYKWEAVSEQIKVLKDKFVDDISPLSYVTDENGDAPVDAYISNVETVNQTGLEVYNKFMHLDYVFEISGSAPFMYKGLDLDLKNFLYKYGKNIEVTIFSVENVHTIPPTLFFLSRVMSRFSNYKFVEKSTDIIKDVDIIITTDPELLDTKLQEGKTIIKIDRPYNVENGKQYTSVLQLVELVDNDEFEKMIGYTKTIE